MKKRCLGCMATYEEQSGPCPYCGYSYDAKTDSPLHMRPGTILNARYTIGRVIGYGGFGVTYIAWDNLLEQSVAIKEYLPSEFATRSMGQSDVTVFGGNKSIQFSDGMTKFIDEAKRLAQFQNEPGIVRVYDSFEANNTAYIIMEYLEGEPLTEFLNRKGAIPVDDAVKILTPVIISLEMVHHAGIIHRDIAPDNIILTKDGQTKLIDFGAARHATTSHSRSLTVIIKPGYSAEEQYRSRGDQGPHTDVYALGAVMYCMVTGVVPPDALERRALLEGKRKDSLLPPSKYCKISKSTENAILNAMNVRIDKRTSTAQLFLEQLTSNSRIRLVPGKIQHADLMRWPLWAKIVVPVLGTVVTISLVLLFTGQIGFENHLTTQLVLEENMTRVPSVVNCTVETAQDKLGGAGLPAIISGRETSDTIPVNMVLRQSLNAGDIVEKNTRVELYISAAAEVAIEDNTMPDVTYYTQAEAETMLKKLGAVVIVEQEYSSDVAAGIVLRSSILAGEPLTAGDTVTVYVSMGTEIVISLNHNTLNMNIGDSEYLSATTSPNEEHISWSSNNSRVASVSSDGCVKAEGSGSATITASIAVDGKTYTDTCDVSVQKPLTLSQTYISLSRGDSTSLNVSGVPSGASVTWTSSNAKIVSVSSDGTLTGLFGGEVTITASCGTQSASCTAVCIAPIDKIEFVLWKSGIESKFEIGGTVIFDVCKFSQDLSAPGTYTRCTDENRKYFLRGDDPIEAHSSNPACMSIDHIDGDTVYVVCKASGDATITLSTCGYTKSQTYHIFP